MTYNDGERHGRSSGRSCSSSTRADHHGPRAGARSRSWKVVGYKKIKFYTHENAGYGDVRLPEMQMHDRVLLAHGAGSVCADIGMSVGGRAAAIDGSRGVGVALETVATLALMCESAIRDHSETLLEDGGVPRGPRRRGLPTSTLAFL